MKNIELLQELVKEVSPELTLEHRYEGTFKIESNSPVDGEEKINEFEAYFGRNNTVVLFQLKSSKTIKIQPLEGIKLTLSLNKEKDMETFKRIISIRAMKKVDEITNSEICTLLSMKKKYTVTEENGIFTIFFKEAQIMQLKEEMVRGLIRSSRIKSIFSLGDNRISVKPNILEEMLMRTGLVYDNFSYTLPMVGNINIHFTPQMVSDEENYKCRIGIWWSGDKNRNTEPITFLKFSADKEVRDTSIEVLETGIKACLEIEDAVERFMVFLNMININTTRIGNVIEMDIEGNKFRYACTNVNKVLTDISALFKSSVNKIHILRDNNI